MELIKEFITEEESLEKINECRHKIKDASEHQRNSDPVKMALYKKLKLVVLAFGNYSINKIADNTDKIKFLEENIKFCNELIALQEEIKSYLNDYMLVRANMHHSLAVAHYTLGKILSGLTLEKELFHFSKAYKAIVQAVNFYSANKSHQIYLERVRESLVISIKDNFNHILNNKEMFETEEEFTSYTIFFITHHLSGLQRFITENINYQFSYDIYQLLIEMANITPDLIKKELMLFELARLCLKNGEYKTAFEVITQIPKQQRLTGVQYELYLSIIKLYADFLEFNKKVNDFWHAEQLYLEYLSLKGNAIEEHDGASIYNGLGGIYFTYTKNHNLLSHDREIYFQQALKCFKKAVAYNSDKKKHCAHMLITTLIQYGEFQEGLSKNNPEKKDQLFSAALNCYEQAINLAMQFNELRKLGIVQYKLAEFYYYCKNNEIVASQYYMLSIENLLTASLSEAIIDKTRYSDYLQKIAEINSTSKYKINDFRSLRQEIIGVSMEKKRKYGSYFPRAFLKLEESTSEGLPYKQRKTQADSSEANNLSVTDDQGYSTNNPKWH